MFDVYLLRFHFVCDCFLIIVLVLLVACILISLTNGSTWVNSMLDARCVLFVRCF